MYFPKKNPPRKNLLYFLIFQEMELSGPKIKKFFPKKFLFIFCETKISLCLEDIKMLQASFIMIYIILTI